jgi:integrase
MVERFKADLLEKGRTRAMTRRILGALKMMLNTAMRQGYAAHNPATAVQAPSAKDRDKKRVEPPSKAEIGAIINAAGGRWRPFIITAVFTGLRASELRGLRWIDVDLSDKNPTLTVNQRADQASTIGRPKSNAGNRTIPLPPMAANALREWRLVSTSNDLVFPSPATGRPERLSNIVKTGYNPIQRRAGITKPHARATALLRVLADRAGVLAQAHPEPDGALVHHDDLQSVWSSVPEPRRRSRQARRRRARVDGAR